MKKNIFVLFFAIILPFLHIEAADIQENILKQEWNAFTKQYSNLTSFSAVEIAEIANQWGQKVAEELDVHDGVREIDPQIVSQLLVLLVQKEPKIFMRHGEQQKTERIQQLPPALQKVEMMRLPDNMENSLTNVSVAELMEGMIVMEYLKQKTHQLFMIKSSENKRAELAASMIAYALKTKVQFDKNLNCINYPPENIMPAAQILKSLPDGTLPWEKEKVDQVIGKGTYEKINNAMAKLLTTQNAPNTIFLAVTHTQQMNGVALLSDLPLVRLGNYGFILITAQSREMFSEGFYKKIK